MTPRKTKKAPKKYVVDTQVELAQLCGRSTATVAYWQSNGMPGKLGNYDLAEIIPWLLSTGKGSKVASSGDPDDPLLAAVDSPGLERYRLAKAELAELELQVRKGTLVPIDAVKDKIGQWASLIRRMGESLAKQFGNEAAEMLNETLEECRRLVPRVDNSTDSESIDTE